ncbi:hypothetical protein EOB59_33105 [Mesorhizobium sp. M7A.F.Ca.MR.176.00.0.0]|uniref:hypothetical protein n=1 Tax=Mesorhizobium sp. M7A.F.Ca.MR.176.00.0.0 TaxID=2496776 RepID=UPI000FD25893|nr:hypothetical protein [Mesorhizobium sp. M7A.F.Ca.MR.176.00.0.0]RUU85041.1 hypothetical protein EOB59_33105 [Mesorhizobium sp. M7A.F.Ca.MR.176.00.0.0]
MVERKPLPPIVTKGTSISPEDARRFAVDLLDNYLLGPNSFYLEGPWKDPYSPHKTVLNGIYDPDHRTKKGTLYYKLSELQSRIGDSESKPYVASLMDGLEKVRKAFGNRMDYEEETEPFENSPEIDPESYVSKNFDRNMVIDPYRFSRYSGSDSPEAGSIAYASAKAIAQNSGDSTASNSLLSVAPLRFKSSAPEIQYQPA